ncbi:MAG: hypothetical protein ABI692_09850 [Terracoccus sp.]
MSVATHLGLNDPENDVLALARARWPLWQRDHPALREVQDLLELPGWLRGAEPHRADGVLLALAELSSPEGRDDVAATGALAWLLLPGASLLAARLATLTPRIDQLLAAQLWVEARTFPWQRGHRVAANILMNTRKSVMRDLGVGVCADRTWSRSVPVDPSERLWQEIATGDVAPTGDELADLLTAACALEVIDDADRDLLLQVAVVADRHAPARSGRGHAGLLSNAVSHEVGQRVGVSAITIRRRTRRSIELLREACAAQKIPA